MTHHKHRRTIHNHSHLLYQVIAKKQTKPKKQTNNKKKPKNPTPKPCPLTKSLTSLGCFENNHVALNFAKTGRFGACVGTDSTGRPQATQQQVRLCCHTWAV